MGPAPGRRSLAAARRVVGYGEKQLADALGVDLPLYRAWEAGLTPLRIVQESLDLMVEVTHAPPRRCGSYSSARSDPERSYRLKQCSPPSCHPLVTPRGRRLAERKAATRSGVVLVTIRRPSANSRL
jgi:hypothetical protein